MRHIPPIGRENQFVFGITDQTLHQIVIPSNGSEPAIGVRGAGVRSKLTASSAVTGGIPFITTVGWGGMSPTTVVEPVVTEVYLDGNQNFTERPSGMDPVDCHAIGIDGDAAEVTACKIIDFAGDGIHVRNSMAEGQRLVRMPRVSDNKIGLCYTGIRAGAVDTQVSGNRVANVRDYCLAVSAGAGNVQSDGNHYYGASTAIKVESRPVLFGA